MGNDPPPAPAGPTSETWVDEAPAEAAVFGGSSSLAVLLVVFAVLAVLTRLATVRDGSGRVLRIGSQHPP